MEALNESINNIKTQLAIAENELTALKAGKKAAAPRVRSALMNIKTAAHSARTQVTKVVSDIPTKSRTKKNVEVEPEVEPEPVDEPVVVKTKKSKGAKKVVS